MWRLRRQRNHRCPGRSLRRHQQRQPTRRRQHAAGRRIQREHHRRRVRKYIHRRRLPLCRAHRDVDAFPGHSRRHHEVDPRPAHDRERHRQPIRRRLDRHRRQRALIRLRPLGWLRQQRRSQNNAGAPRCSRIRSIYFIMKVSATCTGAAWVKFRSGPGEGCPESAALSTVVAFSLSWLLRSRVRLANLANSGCGTDAR